MTLLRRISTIVCVILLAVMIPVSILGVWAKGQLLNEQRFVGTFAPLLSDPEVQVAVTNEVSRIIIEQVDVDAVAEQAFTGLGELGLPDRASAALGLLQGPAAEGMRSLIVGATDRFVTSSAFASVWESALQVSHRALYSAATQDSFGSGVVTTSETGEVALQLGPVVAAVASELEERGFGFASNIGPVEASIVVAQSDALPLLSLIYSVADGVGTWAPIILLLLAGVAVAVSLQRRRTLLQVLLTLLGVSALLLIALAVVVAVVPGTVTSQPEGAAAIAAILSQILAGMRVMSWWIVALSLLGIVATLVFWPASLKRLETRSEPKDQVVNAAAVTESQ